MSHIPGQQDLDLHDPETGEHRITPPSTGGRAVELYEKRISAHLELHKLIAEEE